MLKKIFKRRCNHPIFLFFLCALTYFFFVRYSIQKILQLTMTTEKLTETTEILTSTTETPSWEIPLESRSLEDEIIRVANNFGNQSEPIEMGKLEQWLTESSILPQHAEQILKNITEIYENVQSRKEKWAGNPTREEDKNTNSKTQIYLATTACGVMANEVMVMLKSAALFSQDAKLHIIIFYDDESKLILAFKLLELKMTVEAMGWVFTFEMHEGSYPEGKETIWKNMYLKCTSQRLFFPSLLPHIDAVIYLDADVVVLSNLTEFWSQFELRMQGDIMYAAAANSEPGIYDIYSWKPVPYIPPIGINAGVALMNLTQMREFKFEERAIAVYTAYKEWVQFADQDIINMIFGAFVNRTAILECSYNFYQMHCVIPPDEDSFCKAVHEKGIQIIHGVGAAFWTTDEELIFFAHVFQGFSNLDLLTDSYLERLENLRNDFDKLSHRPCSVLTSDHLYSNAERYLKALNYSLLTLDS